MDSPTPDEIFTHFKAALVSWDAKAAKKLLKKADGIHMEKERRGLRHLDVFMATFAIEWETLGGDEDDFNQLLSDLIDSDFIEKHPVIMVELIQNERLKAVQQVIKKGGVRESWKDKLWIQNIISNFRKMEHKTGRINPHKVDDYIDTILLMVKTGIGLKYADIASNPVYKRTCPIKFVSGLYPLRERTGLFRELVESFEKIADKIALSKISSQNDLYELFSEYPIENKREAREIADVIEYFRGVGGSRFKYFFATFLDPDRSVDALQWVIEACGEISGRSTKENIDLFSSDIENTPLQGRNKSNEALFRKIEEITLLSLEIENATSNKVPLRARRKSQL